MRNYENECNERVSWIRNILKETGAKGIIFGNSGGKDSALVGILSKMATDNVLGVIMPCSSKQNYGKDQDDALLLADKFSIKTTTVDLTDARNSILENIISTNTCQITDDAIKNINPRLRMTTLYALGQSLGYLVAGTGNKSEYFTGYFTKWGDGGYDFNPISDLLATEIFEFLRYLKAPNEIIEKPPSAGLFDGQTDENEMGVTYRVIDNFIENGTGEEADVSKIKRMNISTEHKRKLPIMYKK